MESLAAVGLASNILQFLEFSGKLISGTLELYHSANGATSTNVVLENVSKDLIQLCAGIVPLQAHSSEPARNESEIALEKLSQSCRTLGQEFLQVLEGLKVKGRLRSWQCAGQAFKTVWKAKDIKHYQNLLGCYRMQIASRLLDILVTRERHTSSMQLHISGQLESVAGALDRLEEDHRRLGLCVTNKAAEIRLEIIDALKQCLDPGDQHVTRRQAENNTNDLLASVSLMLSSMLAERTQMSKQIAFIDSLQFPRMFRREENIKEAHPNTFEWILRDEHQADQESIRSSILDWFETRSSVFWISGKAGSGKSTLMKFFCSNQRTFVALNKWAGTRSLIVASFYICKTGTSMQKSQHGLFQTLLYHIFRQDPALITAVCPLRWSQAPESLSPWSRQEVMQTLDRLVAHASSTARFCFFIDGLDEFDGDHIDIISTLDKLASSDFIKVCFSSRPWTVFEKAYGGVPESSIRLQDLTRNDITSFVKDRLVEGTHFLRLKETDTMFDRLVDEIVERSDGVFLWVYLVVRSLRRGMTCLDTASELQERLRELPLELEEYFQQILDSTEKIYHKQAARLYLMRLATDMPLSIVDVSMFAEDNPYFALDDGFMLEHRVDSPELSRLTTALDPIRIPVVEGARSSQQEVHLTESLEITKTRILARCQDLLEFDGNYGVQFLHTTVKDFLDIGSMREVLQQRAGYDFNPDRFLCNSMMLQMRQLATSLGRSLDINKLFDAAMKRFWYHAQNLEVGKQLDYQLLTMLERYYRRHSAKTESWRSMACSGLRPPHYTGWLADHAVEHRVLGFMIDRIGSGMEVPTGDGSTVRRPPLDVALRNMKSSRRFETVMRLLDAGANPNEPLEFESPGFLSQRCCGMTQNHGPPFTSSVWEAYIVSLDAASCAAFSTYSIIASLLMKGADPNIGRPDHGFFRNRLSTAHMSPEKIDQLEALRVNCQAVLARQSKMDIPAGKGVLPLPSGGHHTLPKAFQEEEERKTSSSQSQALRWTIYDSLINPSEEGGVDPSLPKLDSSENIDTPNGWWTQLLHALRL